MKRDGQVIGTGGASIVRATVGALLLVLGFGMSAAARADGSVKGGRLRTEVNVKVPEIVRRDLVNQAVEFCSKVYDGVSADWLLKKFERFIGKAEWSVIHHADGGLVGPIVSFECTPDVFVAFPDGWGTKSAGWWRRGRPAEGEQSVESEQAEERARRVFGRVLDDPVRRSAYRLTKRCNAAATTYTFFWKLELPGRRDYDYVEVYVSRRNGAVMGCIMSQAPRLAEESIKGREEMEDRVAKLMGKVRPEWLQLFLARKMGRCELWWQYEVPPVPIGGEDVTNWDAITGELVSSNVIGAHGKPTGGEHGMGSWYYNPKYCLQDEAEIIKCLEGLAEKRALELEGKKGGK